MGAITIQLLDGPAKGYRRHTGTLPTVLVVATRNPIEYHDYHRIAQTSRYSHDEKCLCLDPPPHLFDVDETETETC